MSFLSGLFGKRKTPREILRENKRLLDRTVRELDKEIRQMKKQDQQLQRDLKTAARQGQQGAMRVMARDIVRTRSHITRFHRMRAQVQTVSARLQTIQSTQAMGDAMKGVAVALRKMNQRMNLPQMQRVMAEFEMQSEAMDMKEEIMGDTMDSALAGEDSEEEDDMTENLVQEVLDSVGLEAGRNMASTSVPSAVAEKDEDGVSELDKRLEKLRKS